MVVQADLEAIAADIVDAALNVHRELGPGLLESAYQRCHSYELRKRGRTVLVEVVAPIIYHGQVFDAGYRLDALVDDAIIVEHKVADAIPPIHRAPILPILSSRTLGSAF